MRKSGALIQLNFKCREARGDCFEFSMKNSRKYTIFSQAPNEGDHPGMVLSLDLRVILSMLKDGWQEEFEIRNGRPFNIETDIADKIKDWPKGFEWINNLPLDLNKVFGNKPKIWKPGDIIPIWVSNNYNYILLAKKILNEGKNLTEIHWREFEKLIGNLLELEGWNVEVTRGTKDGGIDVIAIKSVESLGLIKTIWQLKKYNSNNLVQVKDVRELSAIIDGCKATKGIVVTTNRLTKGAIEWIKKDVFRIDYKDKNQLESWILNSKLF